MLHPGIECPLPRIICLKKFLHYTGKSTKGTNNTYGMTFCVKGKTGTIFFIHTNRDAHFFLFRRVLTKAVTLGRSVERDRLSVLFIYFPVICVVIRERAHTLL